jgi:phenol hydroxylase P5 protein
MITDLLEQGDDRPITLVYGQRTLAELYYDAELRALAAAYPQFTYVPALSDEPQETAWGGERGFVHEVAKRQLDGNFSGRKAYLCGPPPMVEACISTLMQGRLFERDIYTEKFISATDANQARSPMFKRI